MLEMKRSKNQGSPVRNSSSDANSDRILREAQAYLAKSDAEDARNSALDAELDRREANTALLEKAKKIGRSSAASKAKQPSRKG